MKIVKFDSMFLDEILKSFIYSFPGWSIEKAKAYLMQTYLANPDFCFMALNKNDELLGAIFCKIGPSKTGDLLIIESLQVIDEYRNKGAGTSLLKHVINKACEVNISNIGMMSPVKNKFPISWYKKIGFEETGWVELSAKVDKIKNLLE